MVVAHRQVQGEEELKEGPGGQKRKELSYRGRASEVLCEEEGIIERRRVFRGREGDLERGEGALEVPQGLVRWVGACGGARVLHVSVLSRVALAGPPS